MLPIQARLVEEWVRTCNTDCLQRTLCQGNVDRFVRSDGSTSLHLAASLPREKEAIAVARLLLSNGANPNLQNNEGKTSVHIAAHNGYTQLLRLLILNGGDPLLGDRQGRSTIDWASLGHHQHTLRFLNNLLDTMKYGETNCDPKFTLTFIGLKVLGLATLRTSILPQDHMNDHSKSSFCSCASEFQECVGDADASLGTHIVQYSRRQQDQDARKACVGHVNFERPAFLSSHPSLQSLQRQVEACCTDSDSENDMRALQHCLGRELQHGDGSLGECEEMESESTLRELNVASLTINVSSDASCGDGGLWGESYRQWTESYGHQSDEEQSLCKERYDKEDSVSDTEESDRESGIEGTGDVTAKNDFKPDFCTTLELIKCPRKRDAFRHRDAEAPAVLRKELFKVPESIQNFSDTGNGVALEFTTNVHHHQHHHHQQETLKTCTKDTFGISNGMLDCYTSENKHTCDGLTERVNRVSSHHETGIILTTSNSSLKLLSRNGDSSGEADTKSHHQHMHCRNFTPCLSPKSNKNGDLPKKCGRTGDFPGERNMNGDSFSEGDRKVHRSQLHSGHTTPQSSPHLKNKNGDSPGELNKNGGPSEKPNKNVDFSEHSRKPHQNQPQSCHTTVKSSPLLKNQNGGPPGELSKIGDFFGERSRKLHQNQPRVSLQSREKDSDFNVRLNKSGDLSNSGKKPHQSHFSHTMPQSPGKRSVHQSPHQLASSCPVVLSIAEEFLYEDLEMGVRFIERRCPSLASMSSYGGRASGVSVRGIKNLTLQVLKGTSEGTKNKTGTRYLSIPAMNVDGLAEALGNLDFEPGPQERQPPSPEYSRELKKTLRKLRTVPSEEWTTLEAEWKALEKEIRQDFAAPSPDRNWRGGVRKRCFTYLLLDPQITQDLPLVGAEMTEWEKFERFLSAIFYVGKGSNSRPMQHLYEANREPRGEQQSRKVEKIREIWAEELGVVSLHVFHNTVAEEALTREAAMILAIRLQNLCNDRHGSFYGPARIWSDSKKCQLGACLLYRAYNIFLQEGENQLRPSDVVVGAMPP